jgi:HAMP domain-containing protein
MDYFLKRTCLQPHRSLKRQLLSSFTSLAVSAMAVIFVIVITMAATLGSMAETKSTEALDKQIQTNIQKSSREAGVVIEKKFKNLENQVEFLAQVYMDRSQSLFEDIRPNAPMTYPVKDLPTHLETVPPVATTSNADKDMVQLGFNDGAYKRAGGRVSLQHSSFFFQRNCDPSATPGDMGYYNGCTTSNNVMSADIEELAKKSSVLDYFLPVIYESYPDIQAMGMWFYAGGKGAVRYFPGLFPIPLQDYNPISSCRFQSSCENAHQPNQEQCMAQGTCLSQSGKQFRDYTPVERAWFQAAMQNIDRGTGQGIINHFGPYKNAWTAIDITTGKQTSQWMLNFQKAVYDPDRSVSARASEPPVGVITVEMDISGVAESILDIKFFEASSASLVKEDGTVVADKNWDSKNQDTVSTSKIWEFDSGIDEAKWGELRAAETQSIHRIRKGGEEWFMATAKIPATYEEYVKVPAANRYMVLIAVPIKQAHASLQAMKDKIGQTTSLVAGTTAVVLLVSTALIILMIFRTSLRINRPLEWMKKCSRSIMSHATEKNLSQGINPDEYHNDDATEIGELVEEFKTMVKGLGGSEAAGVLVQKVEFPPNPYSGSTSVDDILKA